MKGERNSLLLNIYYELSPFIPQPCQVGFMTPVSWETGLARLDGTPSVSARKSKARSVWALCPFPDPQISQHTSSKRPETNYSPLFVSFSVWLRCREQSAGSFPISDPAVRRDTEAPWGGRGGGAALPLWEAWDFSFGMCPDTRTFLRHNIDLVVKKTRSGPIYVVQGLL